MNAAAMTVYKNYQELVEARAVQRAGEPEWLSALRHRAYERFQALGFPTRKSEAWKYIHLEPLLKTAFAEPPRQPLNSAESGKLKQSFLPESSNRLVFVNGHYQKDESAVRFSGSIKFESLADFLEGNGRLPFLAREIENESNPFTAINTVSFEDGVYFYVPKGEQIDGPVEIVFAAANSGTPFAFHPRIFVFLEEGASAEIVVQHVDLASSDFFENVAAEIYLGKNARLQWTETQSEESGATHFLNTNCRLNEGSFFKRTAFFQGGAAVRDEINIELEGEKASCELAGLAVLSENSQVFHHVKIKHGVPLCTSRQVYKNILAGRAQAEFNSLVHVMKGASRSNAEQLDKNLLLSDTARVYSRPQLRIDNDDVQCSHGATTGQLEKDELFYLQSRGLDKALARQILILGFAREILEHAPLLGLRQRLEQKVQEKIEAVVRGNES